MKLHKWLAEQGIASRRGAEKLIEEGKISVNNKPAHVGQIITPNTDKVRYLKRAIRPRPTAQQVILYHKPDNEIVSRNDPQDRPTVFSRLPRPKNGRWISVGRLDLNTSGLLLFTTDGDLANWLMHPSSAIEREYAVRIRGELTTEQQHNLLNGIDLEDGNSRFDSIESRGGNGHNHWYHITLHSGQNRIIRRLIESQNTQVSRLIRVRYGKLWLPSWLKPGQFQLLKENDIAALQTNPEKPTTQSPPSAKTQKVSRAKKESKHSSRNTGRAHKK